MSGNSFELLTLKHPIPVEKDGKPDTVTHIRLGRLKAKHLRLVPKWFTELSEELADLDEDGRKKASRKAFADLTRFPDFIPLVAALGGISEDTAGEIDFEDYPDVLEMVFSFLSETPSPSTGGKACG